MATVDTTFLLQGGFPETALLPDLQLAQRIMREDVADKALKRDLTALYQVRNVLEGEQLFLYLCLHSAQILSQETLAKEIGVSRATVATDLSRLAAAHLLHRLDPWSTGGKALLRPRPKVFIAHPSLILSVLLRGEEALDDPQEMGRLIEATVVTHVLQFFYRDYPRFGYWRDSRSQREVDLVVDLRHSLIAIEVKCGENPRLRPLDGLPILAARVARPVRALLITKRPVDYGPLQGSPVFRIPAFLFLYLLGRAERRLWNP